MYIFVHIQHCDGIRIYIIYIIRGAVASLQILQISNPKTKNFLVLGPWCHDTHSWFSKKNRNTPEKHYSRGGGAVATLLTVTQICHPRMNEPPASLVSNTHCHALHHAVTHCNTLQHTATQCNTLTGDVLRLATGTHFHALQHTETHCNTLSEKILWLPSPPGATVARPTCWEPPLWWNIFSPLSKVVTSYGPAQVLLLMKTSAI